MCAFIQSLFWLLYADCPNNCVPLEILLVCFSISTSQNDACLQLLDNCPLLNYNVNSSLQGVLGLDRKVTAC